MKKLLLIVLLIVGCINADSKLNNSDEIGGLNKKSVPNKSDNKWSINLGYSSTKGTIFGLARNYRIREKTSVFILGGLLTAGLGVIYEHSYNDKGYVIGAYNGIDLSAGYNGRYGWSYSVEWRLAPFIAYQWVFKNQHCFSIGVSTGLLKGIYSYFEPYSDQYDASPDQYETHRKAMEDIRGLEKKFRAFIFPIISYEYRF